MKVGLIGFGRTGKLVAKEILNDKTLTLEWVLKKSIENAGVYASDLLEQGGCSGKIYSIQNIDIESFFAQHAVDVLVDFSSKNAMQIYDAAAGHGVRIVSAISNYDQAQLVELKRLGRKTAILHSPNITLGINFLMGVAKSLQKIMPSADIEIIEEHFRGKKEVSGTAIRIAKNLGLNEENRISSIRVGGIVGKHEIIFGLQNQTIRLTHESISRASFGEGAIYAANWLINRKRGLYSMEDVLGFNDSDSANQLPSASFWTPDYSRSVL